MAPSLKARYLDSPVLGSLLSLSGGSPAAETPIPPAETTMFLRTRAVRYLLLNAMAASDELRRYVRSSLPVTLLSEDESGRELYRVD
jgi:hypothetical protein